jgi:hypothetical protein
MSVTGHWNPRREVLAGVAALALGLGGLVAAAPAGAATPLDFENWKTDFPGPSHSIVCDAAPCQATTGTQAGILPTGAVSRRATIDESAGSTPVPVLPDMTAATNLGCLASGGDGCLSFTTGEQVFGSLSLDYRFATAQDLTNVGIQIANQSTTNAFSVDAFYFDGSSFVFADQYSVPTLTSGRFTFDFPAHTMADEVLIIYNPLAATGQSFSQNAGAPVDYVIPSAQFTGPVDDIRAELCCVMANVPEPSDWTLMLVGFLGVGAAMRGARRLQRAAVWA